MTKVKTSPIRNNSVSLSSLFSSAFWYCLCSHVHFLVVVAIVLSTKSTALSTPYAKPVSTSSSHTTLSSVSDIQQVSAKLFSIVSELQNPDSYSAEWADACVLCKDTNKLVASRTVRDGEILSLYPVHAIGLYGLYDTSNDGSSNNYANDKDSSSATPSESMIFDENTNGFYFRTMQSSSGTSKNMHRHDVPLLDEMTFHYPSFEGRRNSLFIDVNPTQPNLKGWLGHLAKIQQPQQSKEQDREEDNDDTNNNNCILVPLAGTAPLCALVATTNINKGQNLVRKHKETPANVERYSKLVGETYFYENFDLRTYTNTAYSILLENEQAKYYDDNDDIYNEQEGLSGRLFHTINRNYPGLVSLHTDPDVLVVDNFLSEEECNRIIKKTEPHLFPCLTVTRDEETGEMKRSINPDRTSTNTNLPKNEAPTIVNKITNLVDCDEKQLELLQVLKYTKGQQFTRHRDGFTGPVTASGFQHSGRMVTIFVYLNDVESGGSTTFNKLGLDIKPKKGMAVIHFPASLDLQQDLRTDHEGTEADDDKWLLVTWAWKNNRCADAYATIHDRPTDTSHDII